MSDPVVVGVFEGALDAGGRACLDLAVEAAVGAVRDAGLRTADIDGVFAAYAWEEPSLMFASEVANHLRIEPKYVETVSFGGGSPAIMVGRAARAIRDGLCEVAVVTAASNRASGMGKGKAIAALRDVLSPEYEIPYGAFVPPIYALTAARHSHEFGTTSEQLAAVAVMQRSHATLHPRAAERGALTLEDVANSAVVASPLRRYDCCLVTDFQGAMVLVAPDRAPAGSIPIAIAGTGEAHDPLMTANAGSLTVRGASRSGSAAYEASGLGPGDFDIAELYDSFTITVLLTLEDLGLAPKGAAGELVERGEFSFGGRLPLNTHGGMLSYRTGGISHLIEAVEQLRGTASGGLVEGAQTAIVHGIGGAMSSHGTVVLKRGAR